MTFSEMVDHYFFQLAEEEYIDRDALIGSVWTTVGTNIAVAFGARWTSQYMACTNRMSRLQFPVQTTKLIAPTTLSR